MMEGMIKTAEMDKLEDTIQQLIIAEVVEGSILQHGFTPEELAAFLLHRVKEMITTSMQTVIDDENPQPEKEIELIEGETYFLDCPGKPLQPETRRPFLYNGTDSDKNHVFVSVRGVMRIAPNKLKYSHPAHTIL